MALVKGICKNFGECDLADNREVQEVDKANFVCEECGKSLYPIGGGGKSSGNVGSGTNKKLIGIIAAAVLGVGAIGGGIYAFMGGGTKAKEPTPVLTLNHTSKTLKVGEKDTLIATITPEDMKAPIKWKAKKNSKAVEVTDDGIVIAQKEGVRKVVAYAVIGKKTICDSCEYTVSGRIITEPGTVVTKVDSSDDGKNNEVRKTDSGKKTDDIGSSPGKVNLGYGIYEGPRKNYKADGFGGEIRFTRVYSIDLKKYSGETIEVEPGDRMINVKMENNRIRTGLLKRSDGSQRLINIG